MHGPQGTDGWIPDLHAGLFTHTSVPARLPLVMVQSADGTHTSALGFEQSHGIFSSCGNRCYHADPHFGFNLAPGEERTVRGRLYMMKGTPEEAMARFQADFPIEP